MNPPGQHMSLQPNGLSLLLDELEKSERRSRWGAMGCWVSAAVVAGIAIFAGASHSVRGLPELLAAFPDQQRLAVQHFVSGQVQGQGEMTLALLFVAIMAGLANINRSRERKAIVLLLKREMARDL